MKSEHWLHVCIDDELGVEGQANSKRFMRFGRQQDDARSEPSSAAKRFMRFGREFMRFGREARHRCNPGEAGCNY